MRIEMIKDQFPLLRGNALVYLDSGATTQKPQKVIDTMVQFYQRNNANPHRGAYTLSQETTELYENTREKVAKFIGAKSSEEIIFSKNATESLNLIAYSYGLTMLKPGDEIVLSIMEHHSNLVPWQMVARKTGATLKYMYINDHFEIPQEEIQTKITSRTKIVGITHVSNVTGTMNDVENIISIAHQKGAVVVVDASQSIPHMAIDVQKMQADFLVYSGHKMYAPMGIGVLYGRKELLKKMPPFLMGGQMIEYVYEQETTFASLPNQFEAGTPNAGGVIGLGAAIDFMNTIGYDTIAQHEKMLLQYAREQLQKIPYVKLYMPKEEAHHQGVISFNLHGIHPHDVASILDSQQICIRSGNHCAQPLLRFLKIDSTCRASFAIYNTKGDIDRLVNGIEYAYQMFEKYRK